jgi:uncharacterized LabA/DUF88 family protein
MALFGTPYSGPKEIHYLFIDGGALRGRIKNLSEKFFGGAQFDLDFKAIARNYTKVFYYDALPVREPGESEADYETRVAPSKAIFESAANVDGVHVYEGDARRRRKVGLVQKKVDVMLTVDMLTHSFRKNMHRATLLTGDNDFKPLVDALVQDGMFVTLWYPADETSRELMQAADARYKLTMSGLEGLLTQDSRARFGIPSRESLRQRTTSGRLMAEWQQDGNDCAIYDNNGQHTVSKHSNAHNTFYLYHTNLELLRYFCLESYDIKVPDSAA